jgi:hypothetical protein
MSLIPKSLTVGSTPTRWPGDVTSPIAMVDTGGGPVFLSDPNGYVYKSSWLQAASCPSWTSDSEHCACVSEPVTLELESASKSSSYKYTMDTRDLPTAVQGLTLVMCKVNSHMIGYHDMNTFIISALFNNIVIDYANAKVGLKPN